MTCREVTNKYFCLDKDERVPASVTLHLLFCKKCRTLIRNMSIAAESFPEEMSEFMPQNNPLFLKTMNQIELEELSETGKRFKTVSLIPWLAGAVIIIACFSFLPFTDVGRWAEKYLGKIFIIQFISFFVLVLVCYILIFIDKNLDFFVKKFGLPNSKQ